MTIPAVAAAGADERTTFDPIGDLLARIRAEFGDDDPGNVAHYIPKLSEADPAAFGLALAGVSGSVFGAGEGAPQFSIHLMHQVSRSGPSLVRVAPDGSERPVGSPAEEYGRRRRAGAVDAGLHRVRHCRAGAADSAAPGG